MLNVDKVSVMNIENAVRGARNPMNSWDKSDSFLCDAYGGYGRELCKKCIYDEKNGNCPIEFFVIGENDLKLLTKLCRAGSDHRKFMRQIFVSMDINAPLYFWKEFDTYKVGTVANSCSTMHTLHKTPITLDMFSNDGSYLDEHSYFANAIIPYLEGLRKEYVETKDKEVWRTLIQALPSGFNQMRTVTLSYENLISIYHARKNHKLVEWHILCEAIKNLSYAKELICFE